MMDRQNVVETVEEFRRFAVEGEPGSPDRDEIRRELAADTERFLSEGGRIEVLPPGPEPDNPQSGNW